MHFRGELKYSNILGFFLQLANFWQKEAPRYLGNSTRPSSHKARSLAVTKSLIKSVVLLQLVMFSLQKVYIDGMSSKWNRILI